MNDPLPTHTRRSDGWIAKATAFWEWFDKRDIDKHLASVFIMYGTWKLTEWAMAYALMQHVKSGVEVAAIIAAVTAPYMALQAMAIKYYFDVRSE